MAESHSTPEPTDEALAAAAAREGSDGLAFQALLERFRQPVWRICYRLMGNEHDAQDAAQEVFVRLFLQRDRFDGRSQYRTFVHGVAVRTCLGLRRSRGRRARHEDAAARQATGSVAPPTGERLDLVRMLDVLDETDRALVLLKHAEGYSYEELAALFELSESACKMRVSRARELLRQTFGDAAG